MNDDPELWQPGMVKRIPRLHGDGYDCTITSVTPTMIHFHGPTGKATITRSLYTQLVKEQS